MSERKFIKMSTFFILLFILTIVFSFSASASIVGVNRAELSFEDVLRNGYAEQEFVVSIGTDYEVEFFFDARGEIADWVRIEFDRNDTFVNKDKNLVVKVIVEPPQEVQVDDYTGTILVSTGALSGNKSRMGTDVVAAFEVKLKVSLTDTQILDCNVGGLRVKSAEIGEPILFEGSVSNRGNVRINPEINFEIYSQDETAIVLEDTYRESNYVLPTAGDKFKTSLDWDLEPGQYWARMRDSVCSGGGYVTFSVLERGALQDDVEFMGIENKPWAEIGEVVPIELQFRNTGERVVSAHFKGTISKDGVIYEIIESDPIDVGPGELGEVDVFYEPPFEGQYQIKGRVYYNNKITFEKGSILNAQVSEKEKLSFINIVFIVILFLVVLFALLILKKKRRRR